MKAVLYTLLVISLSIRAQTYYNDPYKVKMDSMAMVKFSYNLREANKNSILAYKPLPKVKFTVTTGINSNINGLSLGDVVQYVDESDFLAIMRYDIRCKVYLTKRVSVIGRTLIDHGLDFYGNSYSLGSIYKF